MCPRFGGEAIPDQAQQGDWLKRQNEELQRQLKDALAKIDNMQQDQPELRRTKLPAGKIADTSIFTEQASSLNYLVVSYLSGTVCFFILIWVTVQSFHVVFVSGWCWIEWLGWFAAIVCGSSSCGDAGLDFAISCKDHAFTCSATQDRCLA